MTEPELIDALKKIAIAYSHLVDLRAQRHPKEEVEKLVSLVDDAINVLESIAVGLLDDLGRAIRGD